MRAWSGSRILKSAPFKSFSYRKLFCERAYIAKGADEMRRNRLVRPLVAFKILSIFSCVAALSAAMCLRTAGFACGRLACGMGLRVVRFAHTASGLKF